MHQEDLNVHLRRTSIHLGVAITHPGSTSRHLEDTSIHPEALNVHLEHTSIHPETLKVHLEDTNIHPETLNVHLGTLGKEKIKLFMRKYRTTPRLQRGGVWLAFATQFSKNPDLNIIFNEGD